VEGLAVEAVPAQVAVRQAQFSQQAARWRHVNIINKVLFSFNIV
jgi:hypothetical protein